MAHLDDIENDNLDEEAKKEKKEFVNSYAGYLEDVEGLSEDTAKAHAGYEANKINFADKNPPSRYDELRAAGYKKRDIPVADLLAKFKDTGSNVMADFKYLPKKEFIRRYGKQTYHALLGFTPAQAAKATKTFAKGTAKIGSALLLNAREEGLKQTPTGSATATTVPQSTIQAPPPAPSIPSEPQEETMAQLNERTTLKESIVASDVRQDNILILQALKAYIDSLPEEYQIDSALPDSTAIRLRQINGVDVLINRALERLSGGSRKKRDEILDLLETERYGRLWGLKSYINENPEWSRMIEAATNPLSHDLLGTEESSDLEWEPLDDEIKLRQIVSDDMVLTHNRLAALLDESPPAQSPCATCGFVQCVCLNPTQQVTTPTGRVTQYLKKSKSHDLVWPESSEEESEGED